MALIRYPGSKEKLSDQILAHCPAEVRMPLWSVAARWEYREPFFGAGAIGFKILRELHSDSRVWLNDADPWLASLWRSVLNQHKALMRRIAAFQPTAESFYEFKRQDGDDTFSELEAGFRKLALHQMSVSGFGFKSGGPLGGRDQGNARYPVDCRWNPERLQRHVYTCHKAMARFKNLRITCGDFSALVNDAEPETFVYIDPPYVEKGPQLYKYAMTDADHSRLAKLVKSLPCPWVVSYDDHPLVRELYQWGTIREVHVTYTNGVCKTEKRPKNKEVVITPSEVFAAKG